MAMASVDEPRSEATPNVWLGEAQDASSALRFSIVVPVLNEGARIDAFLRSLRQVVGECDAEIIVVDGGSTDETVAQATNHATRIVHAPRGRALQQNAGAAVARGEILLFLHADTALPVRALEAIQSALTQQVWGRFDVRLASDDPRLKLVAVMMNVRSRLSGIATGDQCLFVRRGAFNSIGGFPAQPLMEDIEISKRLKRLSQPVCLRVQVETSARRWEKNGVIRTIALMWWLRLAYWAGVSPERLARWYGYGPTKVTHE